MQALRLNPVGEGGIYGRAGLLAHPFMLGPNGNSNGCVSVKDYDAFLKRLSERADQQARGRRQDFDLERLRSSALSGAASPNKARIDCVERTIFA